MKIKTDFDKERELIALPTIAMSYHTKYHTFTIAFMFIYWAFSIEFVFK